jgi:hypothetical protein
LLNATGRNSAALSVKEKAPLARVNSYRVEASPACLAQGVRPVMRLVSGLRLSSVADAAQSDFAVAEEVAIGFSYNGFPQHAGQRRLNKRP